MSVLSTLMTLVLGFAVSGATASGFEALTGVQVSFRLLREPDLAAIVAVPVVTLGAAYILLRNALFGVKRRPAAVALATVLAGLWSFVIGAATLTTIA